ncbi:hypothetical protein MRB53_017362 [Persea americana]|uniref:Uncharacterized protein n=1 Tax=Persea americana TaxID=3435 RepID=A0ACC2M5G8_PERAE|nr:hypothetical protein MRB53_017362 [Persea americana]
MGGDRGDGDAGKELATILRGDGDAGKELATVLRGDGDAGKYREIGERSYQNKKLGLDIKLRSPPSNVANLVTFHTLKGAVQVESKNCYELYLFLRNQDTLLSLALHDHGEEWRNRSSMFLQVSVQ